ncbi:LamG domain-containing protein [Pseudobythopirellula maris]|uniref:LamG domain-containing protein n=1 Tax=Pseudobythopirellula maris TaxID=2527991 RepID=UPI0011B82B33|nr:LamG domain-containing protein [Pseudobythopirellula maris]
MRISTLPFLAFALAASALSPSWGSGSVKYADVVGSLSPDHYYRLDETSVGSVWDAGGSPQHGVHEGNGMASPMPEPPVGAPFGYAGSAGPDLSVDGESFAGFETDNRSLFCNNSLAANLGDGLQFAHTTMTVSLWFKTPSCGPGKGPGDECSYTPVSEGGERLFSNNFNGADLPGDSELDASEVDDLGHLQINFGSGANLVISIDNRFSDPLKSSFQVPHADPLVHGEGPYGAAGPGSGLAVKDNQWHHLVVSRNGDSLDDVLLVVDGQRVIQDRWADSTDSWGVTEPYDARIGTRTTAPDPASRQVFNGWLDEVSVWLGKQLSVAEAVSLYYAALGVEFTPGDYDRNGMVDESDFDVWRATFGSTLELAADGNFDGRVDAADFTVWRDHFEPAAGLFVAVPEPHAASISLVLAGLLGVCSARCIKR